MNRIPELRGGGVNRKNRYFSGSSSEPELEKRRCDRKLETLRNAVHFQLQKIVGLEARASEL